jgi:hypothetical protein
MANLSLSYLSHRHRKTQGMTAPASEAMLRADESPSPAAQAHSLAQSKNLINEALPVVIAKTQGVPSTCLIHRTQTPPPMSCGLAERTLFPCADCQMPEPADIQGHLL